MLYIPAMHFVISYTHRVSNIICKGKSTVSFYEEREWNNSTMLDLSYRDGFLYILRFSITPSNSLRYFAKKLGRFP